MQFSYIKVYIRDMHTQKQVICLQMAPIFKAYLVYTCKLRFDYFCIYTLVQCKLLLGIHAILKTV